MDEKRRRSKGRTSHGGKRCNQSSSPGNSDDHDGIDCIAAAEVEEEEESLRRSTPDTRLRKEDVKAVLVVDTMDIRVGVEDILRDDATEDIREAEVLMDNPAVEDTEIGNLTDFDQHEKEDIEWIKRFRSCNATESQKGS